MNARSHEDHKENLGAYVLGALPELEAELLERHMAGCEICRAEVEDLRPVINAVARSAPQVDPPASLKASLMATVNSEAEVRAGAARPERAPRRRRNWLAGLQPRFAAAAALSVLALGVVIGVTASRVSDHNERTISARINRTLMPSGSADLRVSGDRSNAKVRLVNAPSPGAGHLYEVWVQHPDGSVSPGPTVRMGGDGEVQIPGGIPDAKAVLVTLEKKRVNKPTGPVIMQFNV